MSVAQFIEYHIDDLRLNTQLGSLHRDTEEIPLPQLSYKMLCVLVEHSPAIVSQHELMVQVWGEQVVSDETLKQRIKLLRQALDDTPQNPKYIESVRGRGYRCIATVKQQTINAPVQHDSINLRLSDRLPVTFIQTSGQYWPLAGAFFLIILTVFATVVGINFLTDRESDKKPSIIAAEPQLSSAQLSPANQAYQKGQSAYSRYQSLDNEMAVKFYLQAIELDPNFAPAFAGLADAYSQGVFQFSANESWRKKALDAAYDALMLDNQSAAHYKSLGTAHYVNGHLSQALTANLKAISIDPNSLTAHATLGYLYSERGQLQLALKHHKIVTELDDKHHLNWFHQALTYTRLQQYSQALRWFEKVHQQHNDYHLSTFHYSQLLIQEGKAEQALKMLQNAEQQSPDSLNILKGLAHFYLLEQKPEQALPWLHKLQLISKGENRQYAQLLLLLSEPRQNKNEIETWYKNHSEDYNERPIHSIQLALAASALDKQNSALRHLTQAVEFGWRDSYYLEQLPYFAKLRAHPKFALITGLINRKITLQR